MVKTHRYNTRQKGKQPIVENIYVVTTESPKKHNKKKNINQAKKEPKISNSDNNDNHEGSSDENDDYDDYDNSSIDDEMKDFIVNDDESITYKVLVMMITI